MRLKTKQGAIVSSPRGYRGVVFANGSTSATKDLTPCAARKATAFAKKEALALGVGARGEVWGGAMFDSVVYACRVVYGPKGRPIIQAEDV